jgi:hypothetical protein
MTGKLFNDEDLFEDTTLDPPVDIPEDDPLKRYREKYTDDKGVAKALAEKDAFIERLKRENAEQRADSVAREKVEEIVDRLLNNSNAGNRGVGNQPSDVTAKDTDNPALKDTTKPTITEADVQRILQQERARDKETANVEMTKRQLEEKLGADWKQKMVVAAKALGETPEFFDALAKRNPQAVLALVQKPNGDDQKTAAPSGNASLFASGSVKPEGLGPAGTGSARDQAYYGKLKKSLSYSEYWSPKVQNQLHKDALALGDRFFKTN